MIWLIGVGGAIGAALRFYIGLQFQKRMKRKLLFPLSTFFINISGSFLLGLLVHFHLAHLLQEWLWYFAGIGFCGAFTTFSTFGFETIRLLENRNTRLAIIYVGTSVVLGACASMLGLML